MDDCKSVEKCSCLERIIKALVYIASLDVIENDEDCTKVVEFCEGKAKELIDDFIHITTKHSTDNDIDAIYCKLRKNCDECDVSNCVLSLRHNRNKSNENSKNSQFIFWRDFFDSIHCYLFHIYDFGYRITKNELNKLQLT
eukprot:284004_1